MNQTASSKPGSCLRTQKTQLEYDEYVASADNKPYVSCRSFVVMDSYHSKILQSKNPDEVREMASLTKMMTAYVSIELAKELNYDLQHTFFKVSLKAAQTIGTTANLLEGQVLSIWDLLHGLMLPSGNDAAMVLAENFSERILLHKARRPVPSKENGEVLKIPDSGHAVFVKEMNKMARKLHMRVTHYANPHGLADKANHSTAYELACLANTAMRNEKFAQVVNTKQFSSSNYLPAKRAKRLPHAAFTTFEAADARDLPFTPGPVEYVQYPQTWYNSNKLLDEAGFKGVKTGQTVTAGPCLAIFYQSFTLEKNLVTVTLGSKNIEYRWKDTRRLTLWAEAVMADDFSRRSPVVRAKPKAFPRP